MDNDVNGRYRVCIYCIIYIVLSLIVIVSVNNNDSNINYCNYVDIMIMVQWIKTRASTAGIRFTMAWWCNQMETFSVLLALCVGNSPVTCEFLSRRPVTQSFDVFLDLRLNKRLSKQSWIWWFETPSCSLWRHCNGVTVSRAYIHAIANANKTLAFTKTPPINSGLVLYILYHGPTYIWISICRCLYPCTF